MGGDAGQRDAYPDGAASLPLCLHDQRAGASRRRERTALPTQAALRPLTPSQVGLAYRRAFSCDAPAAILRLGNLTPGDFAIVARKAACFGERDQRRIVMWLEEEAEAKLGPNARRIGF